MSDKVIKEGFMIEVDSWENDGDNQLTRSKDGLTYDDLLMIYDCLMLCHKNSNILGNMLYDEHFTSYHESELIKLFKKYPSYFNGNFDANVDVFNELVYECIGYSEYYIYRAVDDIRVFDVPENIVLEELKSFV